jgi:hypothetical protein
MGSLPLELLLPLDVEEDDFGAWERRPVNVPSAVAVSPDCREVSRESRALCSGFELVELSLAVLVEELLEAAADLVLLR